MASGELWAAFGNARIAFEREPTHVNQCAARDAFYAWAKTARHPREVADLVKEMERSLLDSVVSLALKFNPSATPSA